ncbi:MAG TPA: vitamin K epoxide reductase family protein [Planctomycetota bacterium]|nr:vitamin K epoxide reductase family protein [Planctomycetota bacterium]
MTRRTAMRLGEPAAPPFRYNPSSWRCRVPIVVLAGIAFLISVRLAFYQWRLAGPPWDPVFGSESSATVLDSEVSQQMRGWIGVPDAALGAIAYLGDVIFGLAGSTRRWQYRPWLVVLFGIDVIPLGIVSVVLVGLQGTLVGAWCLLCLATAAVSLALVAFAWDEVWASLSFLRRARRESRSWRTTWNLFWGRREAAGARVALATASP